MFKVPEKYRIKDGVMGSDTRYGNCGAFMVNSIKIKSILGVIASDKEGWEHVSVSLQHRCPTWDEMCLIKDLFWGEDDFVIQMHPVKKDYINNHPYCLHLWRKAGTNNFCEMPPVWMVGVKAVL